LRHRRRRLDGLGAIGQPDVIDRVLDGVQAVLKGIGAQQQGDAARY